MRTPQLTFDFYNLKQPYGFRYGKLILRSPEKNLRFQATSGLLNFQDVRDCATRQKGGIPPCRFVRIPHYTVSTQPIAMPKKRGVEGNFYQIFPYLNDVVVNGSSQQRGDFGIHKDAGTEGTAGCVGLVKGMHWNVFESEMKRLLNQGLEYIPLFVPEGS